LLARLSNDNPVEPAQTLSQRLSGWLDWTDAIALSSALGSNTSAVAMFDAGSSGAAEECEAECRRVRAALMQAIEGDSILAPAKPARLARSPIPAHAPRRHDPAEDAAGYALFRQSYLSLQQSMETSVGNLRRRLRAVLAGRSPAMSRLAMVDAAMERALGAREQQLLSSVPIALRGHFERLRRAEGERLAQAQAQSDLPAAERGAWLALFRKDMQCVLVAELELRFQPVQGLLAALRTC
jgi:hypothetical protein